MIKIGWHPVDAQLQRKLDRLHENLRSMGRVAVAFSGGVDSAFILKVATDTLGASNVLAVTGVSPSVPAADLEEARSLAKSLGVEHMLVDPGEFEDANYLANPANRCYYCKTALYRRMRPLLAEYGLGAIVSGTNADDLGDYRPGLTAAKEQSVREPCAEAGLTKADIRALSAAMGLPTSEKPASPCLASRVPYGEAITPEKLNMIDRAETFLRKFLAGLSRQNVPLACRVRYHDKLARIEVPPEWIELLTQPANRAKIDAAFREIGFQYVAIDLRGFRSGSMNEAISIGNAK
ncbi:MAG TPA: ATP-dependent sacrificial sulfur transferase LarE [Phycisphaerae bacterium]|nr:ATP-dependent sacrificial sulfur transferase LarE [Phycisphaerae bacterium]